MEKLVDELLTLSRLEAGIGSRVPESVNVAELVTEVVADAAFELDARSTPVAFDVRVESLQLASVIGNAELLHRAFENVVRNSVRHTPSGGQVHVVGEYDALRREVRLTIADEGPGVGAAELASIFEPFFRGVAAQGTSGHGLGLAITHRVIQSHGGRISASNRTSGGFAVEIRLPA
jgi:two-component system OmpR family sensor kinase